MTCCPALPFAANMRRNEMSEFQPTFTKGTRLQVRAGCKMVDAVAVEDSRMVHNPYMGETSEMVRYRHNPSGKTPCPDWHYCDGGVRAFYAIEPE